MNFIGWRSLERLSRYSFCSFSCRSLSIWALCLITDLSRLNKYLSNASIVSTEDMTSSTVGSRRPCAAMFLNRRASWKRSLNPSGTATPNRSQRPLTRSVVAGRRWRNFMPVSSANTSTSFSRYVQAESNAPKGCILAKSLSLSNSWSLLGSLNLYSSKSDSSENCTIISSYS